MDEDQKVLVDLVVTLLQDPVLDTRVILCAALTAAWEEGHCSTDDNNPYAAGENEDHKPT